MEPPWDHSPPRCGHGRLGCRGRPRPPRRLQACNDRHYDCPRYSGCIRCCSGHNMMTILMIINNKHHHHHSHSDSHSSSPAPAAAAAKSRWYLNAWIPTERQHDPLEGEQTQPRRPKLSTLQPALLQQSSGLETAISSKQLVEGILRRATSHCVLRIGLPADIRHKLSIPILNAIPDCGPPSRGPRLGSQRLVRHCGSQGRMY